MFEQVLAMLSNRKLFLQAGYSRQLRRAARIQKAIETPSEKRRKHAERRANDSAGGG